MTSQELASQRPRTARGRNGQDFRGSATSEGHKNAPKTVACQIDHRSAAFLVLCRWAPG